MRNKLNRGTLHLAKSEDACIDDMFLLVHEGLKFVRKLNVSRNNFGPDTTNMGHAMEFAVNGIVTALARYARLGTSIPATLPLQ